MHRVSVWFISILLVTFLSCEEGVSSYTTLDGQAQGTTFHIVYRDSLRRDFSSEVDSLFRVIDKSMSLWDSTSLISRINRNDSTVRVDQHFRYVFDRSMEISILTQGAFDITVGPLVQAWGFSVKHQSRLPDSSMVDSLLGLTGFNKVRMVSDRLIKDDEHIRLDVNAIAQGYTVDLIFGFLRSKGIQNLLVEIGGEVRAGGINDRDSIWQLGIDKPVDTLSEHRPLQATLALNNKALATSGNYRKYLKVEGTKWSHVINPSTGYPTQDSLLSVSVLAPDATTADAYATAFLVRGLENAIRDAQRLGVQAFFIYQGKDRTVHTLATPGFFQ